MIARVTFIAHGGSTPVSQKPIQLTGESLAVRQVERRGPAGLHTACTQPVHEVPHLQLLADVVGGVELAARI